LLKEQANGWCYPLVGGTRRRHFDGTNLKPQNMPENAQTPTSRVHALLGGDIVTSLMTLKMIPYSLCASMVSSHPRDHAQQLRTSEKTTHCATKHTPC
jgi:hypothetical protein